MHTFLRHDMSAGTVPMNNKEPLLSAALPVAEEPWADGTQHIFIASYDPHYLLKTALVEQVPTIPTTAQKQLSHTCEMGLNSSYMYTAILSLLQASLMFRLHSHFKYKKLLCYAKSLSFTPILLFKLSNHSSYSGGELPSWTPSY